MGWVLIAVLTAAATAVAHHLGLVEKVAETASEIAGCPRCTVFWTVVAVLLLTGVPLLQTLLLAMLLAYLTDWLGLVLADFAELYDRLWQRQKRRRNQRK